MISLSMSDDESDDAAVQLVGDSPAGAKDARVLLPRTLLPTHGSKDRAALAAEPPSLAAL